MTLEKKYWTAIQKRDSAKAAELSDDPCVVVGAQGVGEVDRSTLSKMLDGAKWKLEKFAISDVHFRPLGDDAAAVAYKVNEHLVVDGKPLELDAFDSSVWVRRDGQWVCVLHTESPAGDPFGRH